MTRHCRSALALPLLASLLLPAAAQDPDYVFDLEGSAVVAGQTLAVTFAITNNGDDIQGFSLGACHDPALLAATDVALGAALAGMNGGIGPDFFLFNLYPDGLTCGSIFSFFGLDVMSQGAGQEALILTYDTAPAPPTSTEICFCEDLVFPPIETVVVVDGDAIVPVQHCGTIELVEAMLYVRGDANGSGALDVSDPIYVIEYLFVSGGAICPSAMDGNGDDTLDIADVLYLLLYLNGMGPPPGAPFPGCGVDLPGHGIGCFEFEPCL